MIEPRVPTLEMLWEMRDATDVLESRFGFADGSGEAGRWVVAILEEYWGVQVDTCDRIVMSDHNALAWVDTESGRWVLKWSIAPDRFPRLAALTQLTAWLDARGLPVSLPIAAVHGHQQVEVGGASLSLQHEIDATLLDTTKAGQVRAAGVTLARLHEALAAYPDEVPGVLALSGPLETQITGWIDTCPEHVPAAGRDGLRRLVADTHPDPLPVQLVHGDFLHGYQSQHRLTVAEAGWWNVLVLWFSLALIPPGDDPTGWGSAALTQLAGGT